VTETSVQRRLAAILAADVVGYSKMMGEDEAGTLAAVRKLRAEVIDPRVAEHQGRLFKAMGDGFLVEFPSVVNAVACAAAIQKAMAERNANLPEDRWIELRIGIHLGDVISEDGDVYGDGVNIAARIEGLAPPGGIAVSAMVHDNVGSRLDLAFEDTGEQQLKNIARPLRVYRLAAARRPAAAAATAERTKPSIAVLPFTNMSGDAEQEYFSDGITEDIITELSRFKGMLVAARNSTFSYKGKSPRITDVGRELDVNYVLEGSVRKSGSRARITAQLIETASGTHLWAERFDRELADVFAVQDEVVHAIVGVIPGQVDRASLEGIKRKTPANYTAYDLELRGRWALYHTSEGLVVAREWLERAIAADPGYALAHASLANVYAYGLYVLGMPPDTALARGKDHALRATILDPDNPLVNAYAGFTYMLCGEWRAAMTHAERATLLNPNDSTAHNSLAQALTYAGQPERALESFARSERIAPYLPDDVRFDCLCDCYYMLRQYDKVIEIHQRHQNVPALLYLVLAATYAQLGRNEDVKDAILNYQRHRPADHDAKTIIKYQVQMCARPEDREHWLEGYRKAGFNV
jgi:adenylate cyclase